MIEPCTLTDKAGNEFLFLDGRADAAVKVALVEHVGGINRLSVM